MLAIYYSLRSFMSYFKHSHVKMFCDNTTAVAVINKMGSSKSSHIPESYSQTLTVNLENPIKIANGC